MIIETIAYFPHNEGIGTTMKKYVETIDKKKKKNHWFILKKKFFHKYIHI